MPCHFLPLCSGSTPVSGHQSTLFFFIVAAEMATGTHSPLYNMRHSDLSAGLEVFGSGHAFEEIVSLGGVAIQIGYFIPVIMVCNPMREI